MPPLNPSSGPGLKFFKRLVFLALALATCIGSRALAYDPTESGFDRTPQALGVSAATLTNAGSKNAIEQPDGKIVVVGNYMRSLVVMRFLANGAADTTFGQQGAFLLNGISIWDEGGIGVALQSNGCILACARTYTPTPSDAMIVRLTSGGYLDTTFGTGGVRMLGTMNRAYLKNIFVQPDGKIVTGGNHPSGIWMARILANGANDTSFGSSGISYLTQSTQNNNAGQVGQVLPLPDGRFLVLSVGIVAGDMECWIIDRLTATGARDPTFTRIDLTYSGHNTPIGSMARLPDGRIALSMPRFDSDYPLGDMIALYTADGAPAGVISNNPFAGTRGAGYYPRLLTVRNDGSLIGWQSRDIVQYSPSLQVLVSVGSHAAQHNMITPLADNGFLMLAGSSIYRYPATGQPSSLTYTFAADLSQPQPGEITVTQNGSTMTDDGTFSIATLPVAGGSVTRTFTVRNDGPGPLTGLAFSLTGLHPSDFTLTPPSPAVTTLAPGGSLTFSVTFAPTALDLRAVVVNIASSDQDENPFNFNVVGLGIVAGPDISIAGYASGSTRDFGTHQMGSTAQARNFTITNTGATSLTGLSLSLSGQHPGDFSTSGLTSTPLTYGASQSFTVYFSAKGTGPRSATLRIASNDPDENPYLIHLTGTGEINPGFPQAPRIEVRQDGAMLTTPAKGVISWGPSERGLPLPAGSPALDNVIDVAMGDVHALALKQDGTVEAWGSSAGGATRVPVDLSNVIAITAGVDFSAALRRDGSVAAWGTNTYGQTRVPEDLGGVTAISSSFRHSLALKTDGTVVSWGVNTSRQSIAVPASLSSVTAVAAGANHGLALKQNGTVVAWGSNLQGQLNIPPRLNDFVAIAAGYDHNLALRRNGTVVAWGNPHGHKLDVPADLTDATAIAAGSAHSVAVRRDGSVVCWGLQSTPPGVTGVTRIAAQGNYTIAIGERGVGLYLTKMGTHTSTSCTLTNVGAQPLVISRIALTGPDARHFRTSVISNQNAMQSGASQTFAIYFEPQQHGPLRATLEIYSNDPTVNPYRLNLYGTGLYAAPATKAGVKGSALTYAPMVLDATTMMVVQKVTFANPTGQPLHGLRLVLDNFVGDVAVVASHYDDDPGLHVFYSKPIAPNEKVVCTLTYLDYNRRGILRAQPSIRGEALTQPFPRYGPWTDRDGTLIPILGVRDTVNGPLVEWKSQPNVLYGVEYSDDKGVTWYSALLGMSRNTTCMMWIDRGQPETYTKPANKAARKYRVRRLDL